MCMCVCVCAIAAFLTHCYNLCDHQILIPNQPDQIPYMFRWQAKREQREKEAEKGGENNVQLNMCGQVKLQVCCIYVYADVLSDNLRR